MSALGRGLYEVVITEALEGELIRLEDRLVAVRAELRAAEAADRIAMHVARVVEHAVAAVDEDSRSHSPERDRSVDAGSAGSLCFRAGTENSYVDLRWDWRSKKNPAAEDVVIPEHHFAMRWNLTKDGGLWMVAPESASEIGCIHTCQGLEVDYIGVIVGPDLIFRDKGVVAQPEMRSKHDKSLNGYKRLLETDPQEAARRAELIIKNTYRTLMTRGMKGCYVYFTDGPLERYFRSRLGRSSISPKGVEKILSVATPSAPGVVRKRSDGK